MHLVSAAQTAVFRLTTQRSILCCVLLLLLLQASEIPYLKAEIASLKSNTSSTPMNEMQEMQAVVRPTKVTIV